ncbi:MAG: hypothetical protein Q7J98_05285 [Kiritimatiellia bacterium]|nr:hypothetical protein [Kiritimatiellia bacterium]
MKKLDWLTLFGWPTFAVIILLSLLASPFLLPDKSPPPTGPVAAAVDVKYTIRNSKEPIVSEEIAEIRALYAPDLFASSRDNPIPASQAISNWSDPKDIILSGNPLFLSFPPASNETGVQWFIMTGRNTDNYGADSESRFYSPERTSRRAKKPAGKHPKFFIELKGELKDFPFSAEIFQDVALPAEQKPWSVQAEMRVNNAGRVEHVLAESTGCAPSIYQAIVKKLYQCHFSNVTQACEGIIIISYPAYFAANSTNPVNIRQ